MANAQTDGVTLLQALDTKLFADSVEWCPLPGNQELLLCGTYQLDDSQHENEPVPEFQTRVGQLHLLKLTNCQESPQLLQQLCLDMPGILDIKWGQTAEDGSPVFALVNAAGEVIVYKVTDHGCSVSKFSGVELGVECLGLSLDWSNRVVQSGSDPLIVCSDSSGHMTTCCLRSSGLQMVSRWPAHDYEAWIAAFDCFDENVVYSGGDDCKLKVWDLRVDPAVPVLTSKRHSMGVCSLQTNPCQQKLLCSGSYDENVIIWDTRQMRSPLSETGVGGGVWRVKWDRKHGDKILTASMHNGAHILDTTNTEDGSPRIIAHHNKHSSMVYGADWCCSGNHHHSNVACEENREGTDIVATCSFYDHVLHLWEYEEKNSTT